MKKSIHPKFYSDAVVVCACGNTFTTGSTVEKITVEICSNCHPFFTGKQRIVDTENLVKKYEEKRSKAKTVKVVNKREKRSRRRSNVKAIQGEKRLTLKDMIKDIQS